MDWYKLLVHDPGCDLAYIRDFVHPDTICSCYRSYLSEYLASADEEDYISILFDVMYPGREIVKFPVYRTMDLLPDRKRGRLFS